MPQTVLVRLTLDLGAKPVRAERAARQIRLGLPREMETRTPYISDLLIGLLIVVVLLLRPHALMGEERRVSLFAEE